MNQTPINLSITDHIETRVSGYHAHWPVDPDTTARLNRIRNSDPYAQSKLRDRYSILKLVLHGIVFFTLAGLFLTALVIIAEAMRQQ